MQSLPHPTQESWDMRVFLSNRVEPINSGHLRAKHSDRINWVADSGTHTSGLIYKGNKGIFFFGGVWGWGTVHNNEKDALMRGSTVLNIRRWVSLLGSEKLNALLIHCTKGWGLRVRFK